MYLVVSLSVCSLFFMQQLLLLHSLLTLHYNNSNNNNNNSNNNNSNNSNYNNNDNSNSNNNNSDAMCIYIIFMFLCYVNKYIFEYASLSMNIFPPFAASLIFLSVTAQFKSY